MLKWHRLTSVAVFVFIILHLIMHLIGLKGVEYHDVSLRAARILLHDPIIELSILLVFFLHILTGYGMSLKIWREKKDFFHQIQAATGVVFSLFFVFHIGHLFFGRFLINIDANFYYIHAAFTAPGLAPLFLTLYGLGIMSFFIHIGLVGLEIVDGPNRIYGYVLLATILCVGAYVTYLLLTLFMGLRFEITPPEIYYYLFRKGF